MAGYILKSARECQASCRPEKLHTTASKPTWKSTDTNRAATHLPCVHTPQDQYPSLWLLTTSESSMSEDDTSTTSSTRYMTSTKPRSVSVLFQVGFEAFVCYLPSCLRPGILFWISIYTQPFTAIFCSSYFVTISSGIRRFCILDAGVVCWRCPFGCRVCWSFRCRVLELVQGFVDVVRHGDVEISLFVFPIDV